MLHKSIGACASALPAGVWTRRSVFRGAAALAAGGAGTSLTAACGPFAPPPGSASRAASTVCQSQLEFYLPFVSTTVQYQGFQQAATAFSSQRSGCNIQFTPVSGGAPAIAEKLTTALAGGAAPALTVVTPANASGWSARRLIVPVEDLFRREKLDGRDFPAALWKPMSHGGKVWLLPLFASPDFILHWNKGHFRQAGLDPEKGPETIVDLDRAIQMLTQEDGGELTRLGMQVWDVGQSHNTLQAWGYAFGGSFYDATRDELTFTHARIQRAVEWYTGWARRIGVEKVAAVSQSVAMPPGTHFFASGRLSLHTLTPPALLAVQKYDPRLEIGAGPLPGEAPGKAGTATLGGHCIGAVAGGNQREAAWDFMKFAGASDEGTTIIARQVGTPGWLKSPGLVELSKDPLQKAYVEGVLRAEHVQLGYYTPAGYDVSPIDDVVAGKRGVRDALEAVNRDANQRHASWKNQVKNG